MTTRYNYKKSIFVSTFGNVMEWYDFAIFGYFAPIIGKVFFPQSTEMLALIKSFLIFSIGYIVRPLGGLMLGFVGDKHGRKLALTIAFFIMSISTVLIGFLPTYSQIGIAAAFLLCLLRILQGLSAGGELVGTTTYIFETAPKQSNGYWSSWNATTSIAGVFLGSLVATIFYHDFSNNFLYIFGWRIVFWLGILLIIPSTFFLRHIREASIFGHQKKEKKFNLLYILFKKYRLGLFSVLLINIFMSVGFYIMFLWLPIYLSTFLKHSSNYSIMINTGAILFLIILIPFAGFFSDKIGSIKLAILSAFLILALTYPIFQLIIQNKWVLLLIGQFLFSLVFCFTEATMPKLMASQFPKEIRYTGTAISYNIATSFFGGTAPLICTLLIKKAGLLIAPGLYLMFCCFLGLCGYLIIYFRKTKSS